MKNKKLFAILTLVCFMMTLMPVAAFAATDREISEVSAVYTTDESASEKVQTEASKANLGIKFDFDDVVTTAEVYVWFVKDGSNVPVAAVLAEKDSPLQQETGDKAIDGVFKGEVKQGTEYSFAFANQW